MTSAESTTLVGRASRTAIVNQLLFAAVVALACALQLLFEPSVRIGDLLIAIVLTAVVSGAAVIVPWHRLAPIASIAIPLADIVVVAFLRHAAPNAGTGLIWAFPAMWIAWSFGRAAALTAVAAIITVYWISYAFLPTARITATVLLLPIMLASLTWTTTVLSQRIRARGELLERQSRLLEQAAHRAQRDEATLREVLDAVDFGVIRLTATGDHVVTNDAQSRLHHHGAQAYAADGVTPLRDDELPLARAQRGETFEGELSWYGQPGADRRALTVTARRLHEADGTDVGAIVVSLDVTAEQLALRAREDLMASVSHELRTPLTSIIGYLDLVLDDDALPPSAQRSLRIAQRNAERLLELIGDILSTAADSRDGIALTIAPEQIDLADVVATAVEAAEPRAGERGIRIDTSGVEPAPVRGDPLRIRQVIDNLLSNAIKYGRDDGRIEVGCTVDGRQGWIVVRDDGPGIAEQDLPRLFERFFRSGSVRNTGIHGTGLGLSISRDIVRRHGGDITVRSTLGEGTTFVVRLPVSDPRGER